MASGVGKFYFVVNTSDHDLQQDYAGLAYELPAGKAARLPGKRDDDIEQFEEPHAFCFKSCFPKDVKQFIKLDRRNSEVAPDEQKSYVDAFPETEKPFPNKDGFNFPDGEPNFGWDKVQLKAYFKLHDPQLYKKVRSNFLATVLVEWWMEKNAPEQFDAYKRAAQSHNQV